MNEVPLSSVLVTTRGSMPPRGGGAVPRAQGLWSQVPDESVWSWEPKGDKSEMKTPRSEPTQSHTWG